jgi:hypothetical protein
MFLINSIFFFKSKTTQVAHAHWPLAPRRKIKQEKEGRKPANGCND